MLRSSEGRRWKARVVGCEAMSMVDGFLLLFYSSSSLFCYFRLLKLEAVVV